MAELSKYFDEIDLARARRAKELSEIKIRFTAWAGPDPSNINSRAVIVLTYASWEGFYNECIRSYVQFLKERGGRVRDVEWMLLLGALKADLESLRDRNHSESARHDFVESLKARLECGFDVFDISVVGTRSNLDFVSLSQNFRVLNFDLQPMQRYRIKLDRELVAWRHSAAHGDQPDLSALNINDHVDFTSKLLIALADEFQNAILKLI